MKHPEDILIPGPDGLSQSVKAAATRLADYVDRDHATCNGRTALYWNLIYVARQHAKHLNLGVENGDPMPLRPCEKGGKCEFRTDGHHSNVFCGKCFKSVEKA
jgi:hypothetical protein